MASKVVHGARAKVYIDSKLVGIFTNVSYGLTYDAQPSFILGRYNPADIDYTAQEAVNISATGWRVYNRGPHVSPAQGGPGVPKLADLLNANYMMFEIYDRAQGKPSKPLMKVTKVRCLGYSGAQTARQLSEVQFNYVGCAIDAENGDGGVELASATSLD
jgi:hypothetical protein